jgi:hypothetical protein
MPCIHRYSIKSTHHHHHQNPELRARTQNNSKRTLLFASNIFLRESKTILLLKNMTKMILPLFSFLMAAAESLAVSTTPVSKLWVSKSCPYAQRAWITSIEKKIDVDLQFVDLANKPKEFCDVYASISPDTLASAKVPIFEDADGFKLIESAVIVQYLDDKFPNSGNSLIPQLASEKALCRLFIDCFEKTMSPLSISMLKASGDSVAIEKLQQTIPVALKTMNRYLECNGTYIYMIIHICIYTYICIYICIYVYIHINK